MSARPSSPFAPAASVPLPGACERLLRLPLAQPARAEQEFIELLDAALQDPPERTAMFEVLEQVRASLCFLREAAVRHYLGDAPHLDEIGERLFQQGIEATRRMMSGYANCANLDKSGDPAGLSGNPGRARQVATILHRCLYYNGMLVFEHYRAKRELPAGIWARHHSLFLTASRLGIAILPVEDQIFEETRPSHCQAAYVAPLLAEQACPYGRSARDLNFIWCWAEKIAPDIEIRPMPESSPVAAFGVDLSQDCPLRAPPLVRGSSTARLLETGAAIGRLRRLQDQLARGVPPERLGLCEEGLDHTRALLEQLVFLWSLENPQRRRHPRYARKGSLRLCAGFQAMHQFILGADPNPVCVTQLKRLDRGSDRRHHEEVWDILDRGPAGYRLACQSSSLKLQPHQLLALRPDDGNGYQLGLVAWLKREQQGRLVAGIALLAGHPRAVAVRPLSQVNGEKGGFHQAFLLRQEAARDGQDSLLLPLSLQGRLGRMEVVYDQCLHMPIGGEIQRGADFVRVGIGGP